MNDPANPSVHAMSLLVGEIKGEVRGLTQSIDSLNRVWGEREQVAVEGRRIVHEKVDKLSAEVRDKIEGIRHDLMRVNADMDNMSVEIKTVIKPAVETFKTERSEHIGASKIGKVLYGLALTIGGGGTAEIFHRLWK